MDNAYVGQANYALNLLRTIRTDAQSVVLSPFAVTAVFGIAYFGAGETTRSEMLDFFANGSSGEDFEKFLTREIAAVANGSTGYTLNIANRLYYKKDFVMKESFLNAVKSKFNGQLEAADFANGLDTAEKINKWVEGKTNSKITQLVTADMFDALTRLMIVGAVYFKGNWASKFSAEETKEQTFYVSEGREVQVEMMHKVDNFDYYADEDVQVVGIPYNGDDVEMFIILPKERFGLEALLKTTDGDRLLKFFHHIRRSKLNVYIPKFKMEKELQLSDALSLLGLRSVFTNEADFSNMTDESVYISRVIHKACIEVNEQGTEAAAAAALTMTRTIRPSGNIPPAVFLADHPFMFAVVKNDNILFIGEYY
uniref:SERPIN domain-containing protein n=1 Tax=Syphacia muris TaxID=451379 RepID=A0A0N5ADB8_9BILA